MTTVAELVIFAIYGVDVDGEVQRSRRNLHQKHLPIERHGKMLMMQALRPDALEILALIALITLINVRRVDVRGVYRLSTEGEVVATCVQFGSMGKEFHLKGEEFPQIYGSIDDCIVSSCH